MHCEYRALYILKPYANSTTLLATHIVHVAKIDCLEEAIL